ncbi:hypothetical protein PanWU01x14_060230 [Parasponia andersonii]|uniref:Uncharacterized protein n=1 Tax=Parasponia andersonii TaxID=3476 RepID=A0A2P5DIP4_PARAD|nr:hypothetical protein PanWU01x14_060230 [Parasponia andersonii]
MPTTRRIQRVRFEVKRRSESLLAMKNPLRPLSLLWLGWTSPVAATGRRRLGAIRGSFAGGLRGWTTVGGELRRPYAFSREKPESERERESIEQREREENDRARGSVLWGSAIFQKLHINPQIFKSLSILSPKNCNLTFLHKIFVN